MGAFSWAEKFHGVPFPAYKISKTTLNMVHKITSLDLAEEGFTVLAISPGVSCPPPPPNLAVFCTGSDGLGLAPIPSSKQRRI